MKWECALLALVAGIVVGMFIAIDAENKMMADYIKAGIFEDHGIAYKIGPAQP